MARCDNCGFQNPDGALVCRRCRQRLRVRREVSGPRRATEGELTLVVAEGLTRLAGVIGAILVLGSLIALPFYRRLAPGLFVIIAAALLMAFLGWRQVSSLRRSRSTT